MTIKLEKFFSSKKSVFAKKASSSFATNPNILQTSAPEKAEDEPNEYIVRLLPYLKGGEDDFAKTKFEVTVYSWKSVKDGSNIRVVSPSSFGEFCPIRQWFFANRDSEDERVKKMISNLQYQAVTYLNCYVVNDPINPKNNGTVKILRSPRQLSKIIEPIFSEDEKMIEKLSEKLGVDNIFNSAFDLSPEGVNLCVTVTKNGQYPSYTSSSFIAGRRHRDLGLSEREMEEIYDKVFELEEVEERKTPEEVKSIFNETFLGYTYTSSPSTSSKRVPDYKEEDGDIPKFNNKKSEPETEEADDYEGMKEYLSKYEGDDE